MSESRTPRHDVFLSYAHADEREARSIRRALQRLGSPWYRLQSMDVFRDREHLKAGDPLWPRLFKEIEGSRYFLLIASPSAAASGGVRTEIEHWLSSRGAEGLLLAVVGGDLAWDNGNGAFDRVGSTCLPPALQSAFRVEPVWVDLRWLAGASRSSSSDRRLRECVAEIAGAVLGKPGPEVVSDEWGRFRQALRHAAAAVVALLGLATATTISSIRASNSEDHAIERAAVAQESLDEVLGSIDGELSRVPGVEARNARTSMLDRALRSLDRLRSTDLDTPRMAELSLGGVHRAAEIASSLGRSALAAELYADAVRRARGLLDGGAASGETARVLLLSTIAGADQLFRLGRRAECEALVASFEADYGRFVSLLRDAVPVRLSRAAFEVAMGEWARRRGEFAPAAEHFRSAMGRVAGVEGRDLVVALAAEGLARAHAATDELPEAERHADAALSACRTLLDANPASASAQRSLARLLRLRSFLRRQRGDAEGAYKDGRDAVDVLRRAIARDRSDTQAESHLADALVDTARAASDVGCRPAELLRVLEEARSIRRSLMLAYPDEPAFAADAAEFEHAAASILSYQGMFPEAERALLAFDELRKRVAEELARRDGFPGRVDTLLLRCEILAHEGQAANASAAASAAISELRTARAGAPGARAGDLGYALALYATQCRRLGMSDEAWAAIGEARAVLAGATPLSATSTEDVATALIEAATLGAEKGTGLELLTALADVGARLRPQPGSPWRRLRSLVLAADVRRAEASLRLAMDDVANARSACDAAKEVLSSAPESMKSTPAWKQLVRQVALVEGRALLAAGDATGAAALLRGALGSYASGSGRTEDAYDAAYALQALSQGTGGEKELELLTRSEDLLRAILERDGSNVGARATLCDVLVRAAAAELKAQQFDRSLGRAREAIALAGSLQRADDPAADALAVWSRIAEGDALRELGKPLDARRAFESAAMDAEEMGKRRSDTTESRTLVCRVAERRGGLDLDLNETQAALLHFEKAVSLGRELVSRPGTAGQATALAIDLYNVGLCALDLGDGDRVLAAADEGERALAPFLTRSSAGTELSRATVLLRGLRADAHDALGHAAESRQARTEALRLAEGERSALPHDVTRARMAAAAHTSMARVLLDGGELASARGEVHESIEVHRRLLDILPMDAVLAREHAWTLQIAASIERESRNLPASIALLDEARKRMDAIGDGPGSSSRPFRTRLVAVLLETADCKSTMGAPLAEIVEFPRAIAAARALVGDPGSTPTSRARLARALRARAEAQIREGRYQEASSDAEEALGLTTGAQLTADQTRLRVLVLQTRAVAERERGDLASAGASLGEAVRTIEPLEGGGSTATGGRAVLVDSLLLSADVARQAGAIDAAVRAVARARACVDPAGASRSAARLRARVALAEAMLHTQRGELRQAAESATTAVDEARRASEGATSATEADDLLTALQWLALAQERLGDRAAAIASNERVLLLVGDPLAIRDVRVRRAFALSRKAWGLLQIAEGRRATGELALLESAEILRGHSPRAPTDSRMLAGTLLSVAESCVVADQRVRATQYIDEAEVELAGVAEPAREGDWRACRAWLVELRASVRTTATASELEAALAEALALRSQDEGSPDAFARLASLFERLAARARDLRDPDATERHAREAARVRGEAIRRFGSSPEREVATIFSGALLEAALEQRSAWADADALCASWARFALPLVDASPTGLEARYSLIQMETRHAHCCREAKRDEAAVQSVTGRGPSDFVADAQPRERADLVTWMVTRAQALATLGRLEQAVAEAGKASSFAEATSAASVASQPEFRAFVSTLLHGVEIELDAGRRSGDVVVSEFIARVQRQGDLPARPAGFRPAVAEQLERSASRLAKRRKESAVSDVATAAVALRRRDLSESPGAGAHAALVNSLGKAIAPLSTTKPVVESVLSAAREIVSLSLAPPSPLGDDDAARVSWALWTAADVFKANAESGRAAEAYEQILTLTREPTNSAAPHAGCVLQRLVGCTRLADLRRNGGQREAAAPLYEEALRCLALAKMTEEQALRYTSILLSGRGDLQASADDPARAIESFSRAADAQSSLARLDESNRDRLDVLERLLWKCRREAAAKSPDEPRSALANLGLAYQALAAKDFAVAVSQFEAALRALPELGPSPLGYHYDAACAASMAHDERALTWLAAAFAAGTSEIRSIDQEAQSHPRADRAAYLGRRRSRTAKLLRDDIEKDADLSWARGQAGYAALRADWLRVVGR